MHIITFTKQRESLSRFRIYNSIGKSISAISLASIQIDSLSSENNLWLLLFELCPFFDSDIFSGAKKVLKRDEREFDQGYICIESVVQVSGR